MAGRRRYRSSNRRSGRYIWTYDSLSVEGNLAQNDKGFSYLLSKVEPGVRAGATVIRQIGQWGFKPLNADESTRGMFSIYMLGSADFTANLPEVETEDVQLMYQDQMWTDIGTLTANGSNV